MSYLIIISFYAMANYMSKVNKKGGFPKTTGGFTEKQRAFVREYLIDLNATQAAIRAGYSKKTAVAAGSRLLRNVYVARALREKQEQLIEKTKITQERVLNEYAKIAFLDPRQFYDKDDNLIPIPQLPADVAAALSGVDVSEIFNDDIKVGALKKIKFADKRAALDSLAKHLGMFAKDNELNVTLPPGLKVIFEKE